MYQLHLLISSLRKMIPENDIWSLITRTDNGFFPILIWFTISYLKPNLTNKPQLVLQRLR